MGFQPLTEYLDSDAYFQLIDKSAAAIFGHRRQSGAGNIFYLLARGVKVFLREENSIIKYLKDKGVKVFSIEEDLKTYEDLKQLPKEIQEENKRLVLKEFTQEEIDKVYLNLF